MRAERIWASEGMGTGRQTGRSDTKKWEEESEDRGPLRPSACRLAQGSQIEDGAEEDIRMHRVAAKALMKGAESHI